MMTKIHRYTVWPLRLLVVSAVIFGGFGGVVCLGEGGDIKVEIICQSCYCESAEACANAARDGQTDNDNHCTNCTDLSADEFTWSRRPSSDSSGDFLTKGPDHPASACLTLSHGTHSLTEKYHERLPDGQLSLAFLTTTVLLC